MRRWDGFAQVSTAIGATFAGLAGTGLEVAFSDSTYVTGDWWWIPTRSIGSVVGNGTATPEPPHGPKMRSAKLATLTLDGTTWTVEYDCRALFPAATEQMQLQYVGGGFQTGAPTAELSQPLRVAVLNGKWPVTNWPVEFTAAAGSGSLAATSGGAASPTLTAYTDSDGIATAYWTLGDDADHSATARIKDHSGTPIAAPVMFWARQQPRIWLYDANFRVGHSSSPPYLDPVDLETRPDQAGGVLETEILWDNAWTGSAGVRLFLATTTLGITPDHWGPSEYLVVYETNDAAGASDRFAPRSSDFISATHPAGGTGVSAFQLMHGNIATTTHISAAPNALHRVRAMVRHNAPLYSGSSHYEQVAACEITFKLDTI